MVQVLYRLKQLRYKLILGTSFVTLNQALVYIEEYNSGGHVVDILEDTVSTAYIADGLHSAYMEDYPSVGYGVDIQENTTASF